MDLPFHFDLDSLSSDTPGGLDVLNDFALSRGKRFRPLLLMKVAACLSVQPTIAAPFAVIIERIHNATLLHDDVVDESPSRRGRATINASGENKKAILGGDLLLARTLQDLGDSGNSSIIRDMFGVLVELTEGEWLQLEARHHFEVELRHLRQVARKKTGSLIGWCCAIPARLRGDRDSLVDSLREFGVSIGVAFQLIDDCLDFDQSSGKPFAQDLKEGQINFVTRDLLEKSPHLKLEIKSHFASPASGDFSADFMRELESAKKRVLELAEREIVSAGSKISFSALKALERQRLEDEVLSPFLRQISAMREKI
jgi:octaprenyl-diphosphate synthase